LWSSAAKRNTKLAEGSNAAPSETLQAMQDLPSVANLLCLVVSLQRYNVSALLDSKVYSACAVILKLERLAVDRP